MTIGESLWNLCEIIAYFHDMFFILIILSTWSITKLMAFLTYDLDISEVHGYDRLSENLILVCVSIVSFLVLGKSKKANICLL